MTIEEIEKKAKDLSQKLDGEKVTPIVLNHEGEQVIGFFREVSYDIRLAATDAFIDKQTTKAAEWVMQDALIKEESDPRIMSQARKDANIRASFVMQAVKLVAPLVDEYKKK